MARPLLSLFNISMHFLICLMQWKLLNWFFTELILFMIKEYSFENALFIYNKLLEMGESNIEYLFSLNKSDIYFYFMGGVSSISA